nr:biotin--[acetyl-CoA-carboxylase] ligase [uncultured Mediterraneibacter sp.]
MKTEILKLLRETDGYVSGQQISGKFGVSRTAVWKVIRQLQDEGYQVEAVRNKGYRIVDSPDVITGEELASLMKTRWAGRNILYYDVADSTNLRVKQAGDEGAPHGTLAVADMQSAGRGRRGRSWESPAGSSIYMSLLLRPNIAPNKASMLTLVMALSTVEGIRQCLETTEQARGNRFLERIPELQIKWPNDIIINGRKLAGILTEMSTQIDYINHITVGVGINVNMSKFPSELVETATSLRLECGHVVRRAPLIAAVMERFEENYEIFLKTEDLTGLTDRYSALLVNRDRDVLVMESGGEYRAHALGIASTGELIVQREDGTVEKIYAGEVSVRGVYGYI